MGTRGYESIRTKSNVLTKEFRRNPKAEGAHILPALEKIQKPGPKVIDEESEMEYLVANDKVVNGYAV